MTIPQRLRDIAFRLRKPRDGRPWGADDGAADLLYAIAAELEAPAADAVQARGIQEWADSPACAGLLLVRQRDHLAGVAALQAQIDTLRDELARNKTAHAASLTEVIRRGIRIAELDREIVERRHVSFTQLDRIAEQEARINALEARQAPSSAEDEFAVVWPDGGRFIANTLESARNYMSGAVPSCAERGVEPPVIVRYVPADTVPYEPQQDTSKEQP